MEEAEIHRIGGRILLDTSMGAQSNSSGRRLEQHTAVIVQIELGVAPFGTKGRAWVERFRAMLDKDSERLGIGMEMSGFGSDVADSVKYVYAAWPKMILIVTSIVLVMVERVSLANMFSYFCLC